MRNSYTDSFSCFVSEDLISAKNDFVQLVHFLFCILLIQPHFRHTHYFSLPLSRRSVRQKKSNQRKNISCLCVDLRPSTSIHLFLCRMERIETMLQKLLLSGNALITLFCMCLCLVFDAILEEFPNFSYFC